jgi:hypothetical protein
MTVLLPSDVLGAGETYTFTYDSGKWFQPSEQNTLDQLRQQLVNLGDVVSVSRGFMSGRYVVTVVPKGDYTLADWMGETDPPGGFRFSFNTMGWTSASFVQAEGGAKSSKAGGLSEVVTDTAGAIASTAGSTLSAVIKPLAPYLIVGAGILLTLEYMRHRK